MVVREEGVLALWKGLTPSLMRGMFFGGLRLGMYNPAKQWLMDRERAANGGAPAAGTSMSTKVVAGTLSGTGAALVCSPTELLKVCIIGAPGAFKGQVKGFGLQESAGRRTGGCAYRSSSSPPYRLPHTFLPSPPHSQTRMQAGAGSGQSTMGVLRDVVRQDGLAGLYRGATPGVVSVRAFAHVLDLLAHTRLDPSLGPPCSSTSPFKSPPNHSNIHPNI